jgi:hypothetical protein
LHGGVEGVLGGAAKRAASRLLRVALHHRDGVEHLGGDGAGVGHAVLAVAREARTRRPIHSAGQHHQHQDAQHLAIT